MGRLIEIMQLENYSLTKTKDTKSIAAFVVLGNLVSPSCISNGVCAYTRNISIMMFESEDM